MLDFSIAAILNQAGRPVAFFSQTLESSEQNESPVEKEAFAVIESLRAWRHFLLGRHFKLTTDQRSVSLRITTNEEAKLKMTRS